MSGTVSNFHNFYDKQQFAFFMFAVSCKRGRKFLWYPKKNERASNSVHLLTAANILKKIFLESLFLRSSTFKNLFCVCACVTQTHFYPKIPLKNWRMPLKELSFVIKVCVPVSTVTLWILYSLCEIWVWTNSQRSQTEGNGGKLLLLQNNRWLYWNSA